MMRDPHSKPLTVYIAGRWNERLRLREVAERIERTLPIRVTSRWLNVPDDAPHYPATQLERVEHAAQDLEDIDESDVLILDLAGDRASAGRYFEAGYALGTGMELVMVGKKSHIFDETADLHFEDWEDCIRWLRKTSQEL